MKHQQRPNCPFYGLQFRENKFVSLEQGCPFSLEQKQCYMEKQEKRNPNWQECDYNVYNEDITGDRARLEVYKELSQLMKGMEPKETSKEGTIEI